jgi:hypothetical protein
MRQGVAVPGTLWLESVVPACALNRVPGTGSAHSLARRSRAGVSDSRSERRTDDSAFCGRATSDDFAARPSRLVCTLGRKHRRRWQPRAVPWENRRDETTQISPIEKPRPTGGTRGERAGGRRVEATLAPPIARVGAGHPVAGVDGPCLRVRPGARHRFRSFACSMMGAPRGKPTPGHECERKRKSGRAGDPAFRISHS